MRQIKRSGDHNFHEIEKLPKNLKKINKKSNRYIFGVGEASNHNHVITMPKKQDYEIYVDENGNTFFELKTEGLLTHELGNSGQKADH